MGVERDSAREIHGLDADLERIRGTAAAPRGDIVVETDVGGRITQLAIFESALWDGPQQLASVIVGLHQSALEQAMAAATALYEVAERKEPVRQGTPSRHESTHQVPSPGVASLLSERAW